MKTLLMCSLRSLTSGVCASDLGRCTAGPEKVLQLTRVHSVGKKWTWTLSILWATSGQLCADFWLPPRSPNPRPINYVTALIAGLVDAGAEIEMASGVKDRNLVSNRTRHVNKSTSRFVFFCWRKVPCEMHCMIWINGFITMKVPLFIFLPPPRASHAACPVLALAQFELCVEIHRECYHSGHRSQTLKPSR